METKMKLSPAARGVMGEMADAYVRAGFPSIKTWAFERTSFGSVVNELQAHGLLQPMTPRALRLSEKGQAWIMANLVPKEVRWASAVFSRFADEYAQHMTGQWWFRRLDELEADGLGLDLQQTKVAVKILLQKGLISSDASGEGSLELTDLGKDTCLHPETLDVRLGPRGAGGAGTEAEIAMRMAGPGAPQTTIYNVTGMNARFNMNSVDASTNIVDQAPPELFDALRQALNGSVPSPDREELIRLSRDLEADVGKGTFREHYVRFMGLAAMHIEVVTPFLPALTQLLTLR
jgi:hypothetical protein